VKSRYRVKPTARYSPRTHGQPDARLWVPEELETGPHFVDKTFLEPAAGHGNFLVAILRRKSVRLKEV